MAPASLTLGAIRSGKACTAKDARMNRLIVGLLLLGVASVTSACATLTALQDAAKRGDVQGVRTLLEQGAQVDEKTTGIYLGLPPDTAELSYTALHFAALYGHTEVVKLLLDRGANINAKALYRKTPLHMAAFNGHIDVARLLLERGALAGETDGQGKTAAAVAKGRGNAALARLLEQAEMQQLAPGRPIGPAVATRPPAPKPVSPPAAQPSTTSGSAFLLRQTNLVLTNYHVVRDRKELTLRFPSGEEYRGRVVAQDRSNDLALVEAQGLTPSSKGVVVAINTGIKVGEPIHALGYPLGPGFSRHPSMVSGTVSSTVGLEDDIARFRMTAPINPGNSGGPIVNARGQVIGVAAAGLVREGVEAIRFGIKASTAALILQQAQVTTAFDVVVSPAPAGPRAPDQIFSDLAPAVVLIETR